MTSRLTRYLFIDPATQMVDTRFVHLDHKAMLSIIGCKLVETVGLPSGDILWYDGEPVQYGVVMDGIEIAGIPVLGSRCLVMGRDHPVTELPTDCRMTAAEAIAMIEWMPRIMLGSDDCIRHLKSA